MSFIERLNLLCPLFEVSFERGSPVLIKKKAFKIKIKYLEKRFL